MGGEGVRYSLSCTALDKEIRCRGGVGGCDKSTGATATEGGGSKRRRHRSSQTICVVRDGLRLHQNHLCPPPTAIHDDKSKPDCRRLGRFLVTNGLASAGLHSLPLGVGNVFLAYTRRQGGKQRLQARLLQSMRQMDATLHDVLPKVTNSQALPRRGTNPSREYSGHVPVLLDDQRRRPLGLQG